MKYAVYAERAIMGIGATIEAAIADANIGPLVPMSVTSSYFNGGVVDMTHCQVVTSDTEAASGADGKIRRCSDRLYDLVERTGGVVEFTIGRDGVLDIED